MASRHSKSWFAGLTAGQTLALTETLWVLVCGVLWWLLITFTMPHTVMVRVRRANPNCHIASCQTGWAFESHTSGSWPLFITLVVILALVTVAGFVGLLLLAQWNGRRVRIGRHNRKANAVIDAPKGDLQYAGDRAFIKAVRDNPALAETAKADTSTAANDIVLARPRSGKGFAPDGDAVAA